LEAAQPDRRVDLDLGAHPCRAIKYAFGERALGPRTHVLDGKSRLQRRDLLHRIYFAHGLGGRTVEDSRFVEMDMRLDQPGAGEPPTGIVDFSLGRQALLDGGDRPARNPDVYRSCRKVGHEPRIAHNQIHPRRSRF